MVPAAAVLTAATSVASLAAAPEAPLPRPTGRAQAVALLTDVLDVADTCLSPAISGLRQEPARLATPARRAVAALYADPMLVAERRLQEPDGVTVRWSADRWAFDRLDGADIDGNGRPDAAEAALSGIREARRLLSHHDFPSPGPVDVVLARLGSGIEGMAIPGAGRDGRTVLLVDVQPRSGIAGVRRSAAHQYAHAVASALGPGLPASWGEALASWVGLALDPSDDRMLEPLARRLDRLSDGLGADDTELAAGDSAWLTFLEISYGPTALRLTFDELARPGGTVPALDRALRRAVGVSFPEAFREFQLWTVLVGDRADLRHFPFAARLPSPSFASAAEGLPAVSVLGDPAVAPAGATAVRLAPVEKRGGMTVRLEGEVGARWEADLLLLREGRAPHRLSIPVAPSGKGEVTVPLEGVTEALLLVRNVDPDARGPRRFTWSAFRDAAYPFEIGAIAAEDCEPAGCVLISWETLSEAGVLGFDVLRTDEGGGAPVRINPVWVPAVGDRSTPALYQFVDAEAEAGVGYIYRIEGITPLGLTSLSDPVSSPER